MLRSVNVVFVFIFSQVLVFLFLSALYVWIDYVDEEVVKGSSLGFNIGDSKEVVYNSVFKNLSALSDSYTQIFVSVKVDGDMSSVIGVKEGYGVLAQTYLHEVGYENFQKQDQWEFYLDGSRMNVVKLKFCEGKLCSIYRHKQIIETL